MEGALKHRILLVFLFLLYVSTANAQLYTITDLGPISPTAINSWDQVAGNYNGHAYLWEPGRRMRDLGTLSGGTSSYAASINDLGVVTGTADGAGTVISTDSAFPDEPCSDLTQPFVWTAKTGMTGIGTIGVQPDLLYPYWCQIPFYGMGIDGPGQVVGFMAEIETYQFAFSWTSAGGWSLFGSSYQPSISNGITDRSVIFGQTGDINGEATLWREGVETGLGALGEGVYNSSANGATDQGEVAGWSTTAPLSQDCLDGDPTGCPFHAVLWTRQGEISDLGTLSGDTFSMAVGINYFGQVIGSSGNLLESLGPGATLTVVGRPLLWTERKGMQDLNTLIRAGSGWVLNSVSGINVWGQIVGSGTFNGETRGFLLTP